MASRQGLWLVGFLVQLLLACGDAEPRYSLSEIEPPENFDVELCADVVRSGPNDEASAAMCRSCCQEGGFSDESQVLADACVCANLPERPSDDAVCATASDDDTGCMRCCYAEGFAVGEATATTCTCTGVADRDTCADATGDPDPLLSCQICCVQQGYLSITYSTGGEGTYCICKG